MTPSHYPNRFARRLALLALVIFSSVAPGVASAFNFRAYSENPFFSNDDLLRIIDTVSDKTGWNVPNDDRVRVLLYSKGGYKSNIDTHLFFQEIRLERRVTGLRAPYGGDYWLPIYESRVWGTGERDYQLRALNDMTAEFFEHLNREIKP